MPEAVAGDAGIVVGSEVIGVALKIGRDASQTHLIEQRWVPLLLRLALGHQLGESGLRRERGDSTLLGSRATERQSARSRKAPRNWSCRLSEACNETAYRGGSW